MTGPPVDPLADYSPNWRKIRPSAPSASPDDPLADYHPGWRGMALPPAAAADATSALARNRPDASGDYDVIGHAVAANAANVAQGIPGMEAAEAGARALVRRQPYREALSDIRAATGGIPTPLRAVERIAGSAPLIALTPVRSALGAVKAGAALSGADAALQANPDVGITDRAKQTVKDAAIGGGAALLAAGLGKAAVKGTGLLQKYGRIKASPSFGELAQRIDQDITTDTKQNYGQAEAEGIANGGTSPALQKALEHPRVKPFVDLLRDDEEGAQLTDAEAASEAYKLMSKQRRGLKDAMKRNGYDAAKDLEATRLGKAMKQLKDATETPSADAPAVMPSFPTAVAEKARMEGEREAFNAAADAAPRIMRNGPVSSKYALTRTPEAFSKAIDKMSPGEAREALAATLARASEGIQPKIPNQLSTLWGSTSEWLSGPGLRLNRIAPFIDQLDRAAGNPVSEPADWGNFVRALMLANATRANR